MRELVAVVRTGLLTTKESEHLMRRIVAESDEGEENEVIALYNENVRGAGEGMDQPYVPGSVAKLGYGVDKYVLLRVAPFPDLYEVMAGIHFEKKDESSSLIAAEACNQKVRVIRISCFY